MFQGLSFRFLRRYGSSVKWLSFLRVSTHQAMSPFTSTFSHFCLPTRSHPNGENDLFGGLGAQQQRGPETRDRPVELMKLYGTKI